jgi:hypothetical protein
MFFSEQGTGTRVDQGTNILDGVVFEHNEFQNLQDIGLSARSIDEMDHSLFLQDYNRIFPIAIRTYSLKSENSDNGAQSHEFHLPHLGTYAYGFVPQIFLDGIVAVKEQKNVSHGDGNTAEGYIQASDGPYSEDKTQLTLLSGQTKHVADWMTYASNMGKLSNALNAISVQPTHLSIYDTGNNSFPSPTDISGSTTDITGQLTTDGWYYVHAVSFEADETDIVNTSNTNLTMYLVKATDTYKNLVAEGRDKEPYRYCPGYTIPNQFIMEADSNEQMFYTSGEYSFFLNQLFRDHNKDYEDERLAKVYTDDRFYLESDPLNPQEHMDGRVIAQRRSRDPDTVYALFRHPYTSKESSIPTALSFVQTITAKMEMMHQEKYIVYPKKSEFDSETIFARPMKNKSTGETYTNEELRRGKKTVDSMEENNKLSEDLKARLEVVVVDAEASERQLLDSTEVPVITRQPQVWHDTISHSKADVQLDSETGMPDLESSLGDQFQDHVKIIGKGIVSEVLVYARQKKRIDDGKVYDLRCYQDPITQTWQSGIFSVSFNYDSQPRTVQRDVNKGTSENVQQAFYDKIPNFGCEAALHIIPFSIKPSDECSYAGTGHMDQHRATSLRLTLNRLAFFYTNEEGQTQLTDLKISAIFNTYQIHHYGIGQVFRSFSYKREPPITPSGA